MPGSMSGVGKRSSLATGGAGDDYHGDDAGGDHGGDADAGNGGTVVMLVVYTVSTWITLDAKGGAVRGRT
jgi:hypothetical protein